MSEPNLDFVPDDDDFIDHVEIIIPPTAEADYQNYLEVANGPNKPFGDLILSFEEFVVINYSESLSKHQKLSKLGFAGNAAAIVTPENAAQAINVITDIYENREEIAKNFKMARSKLQELNNLFRGGNKMIDIGKTPPNNGTPSDSSDGGGGSGGGSRNGMSGGAHYSANLVSLAPSPIEIKLDTGIKTNLYGPFGNYCEGSNSPLHLTGYHLNLAPLQAPFLDEYYSSSITLTFQILAQEIASFNINSTTTFSYSRINQYMSAITNALSDFYFFSSILAFVDNRAANNNAGMEALRNMITADDINEFWLLRDVLRNLPIPPNLNHMIFYLNQTYASSELPNCPLIKLNPMSFTTSIDPTYKFDDIDFASNFRNGRSLLTNDLVRDTGGFINKVCPGWRLDELLAPIDRPIYDTQFLTLWKNAPFFGNANGGVGYKYPVITSYTEEIPFYTCENDLDGAIVALLSPYYNPLTRFSPILGVTVISGYATTRYTNRISYYTHTDGTKGFYPVASNASLANARGESYTLAAVEYKYQPAGTELVKGLNHGVIVQCAANLLSWLMTFDTIGSGLAESKRRVVPPTKHSNSADKRPRNDKRKPRRTKK